MSLYIVAKISLESIHRRKRPATYYFITGSRDFILIFFLHPQHSLLVHYSSMLLSCFVETSGTERKHRLIGGRFSSSIPSREGHELLWNILRAKTRLTEDEGMKEIPDCREKEREEQKKEKGKERKTKPRGRMCVPPWARQTQTTADLVGRRHRLV